MDRADSLDLNLLILFGYRNAVSADTAMPVGEIVRLAGDPLQTDGSAYGEDEVMASLERLIEDERIRVVRGDFDSSGLVRYATGLHPDHSVYITPIGILFVKRLTDQAESDASANAKKRREE